MSQSSVGTIGFPFAYSSPGMDIQRPNRSRQATGTNLDCDSLQAPITDFRLFDTYRTVGLSLVAIVSSSFAVIVLPLPLILRSGLIFLPASLIRLYGGVEEREKG